MEPSTAAGSFSTRLRNREPIKVRVLALIGLAGVGLILVPNLPLLGEAISMDGPELLLWAGLILVVNLFFHFENQSFQFTLDVPLLLAVAALYEPAIVAGLALVAEVDVREVERRVSLPRAIFNRTQIAISAFFASSVFHAVGGVTSHWPKALFAMGLAWGAFYVLNGIFVMLLVSIRESTPLYRWFHLLRVGRFFEFTAISDMASWLWSWLVRFTR